jgi:hypothetical protein
MGCGVPDGEPGVEAELGTGNTIFRVSPRA